MSQEIGYARVSKTEQHLALQIDALKKRGVVRVFTDKQTGVRFDRKAFLAAMEYLNEGDTLVVWKLDRLGRSLKQLIKTLVVTPSRGDSYSSRQQILEGPEVIS
jgi:DNA invertase Pin-like site-specific DNA recombinase